MLSTIKKLGVSTLALSILSLPLSAAAAELVIDNQTFFPSTSKINNEKGNAQCSDKMPLYGVTPAHTKNIIPEYSIRSACMLRKNNCSAEVYMTDNCSGPVIAMVVFDVKQGIQSITNFYGSEGFMIANPPRSPFYVDIMGGPVTLG